MEATQDTHTHARAHTRRPEVVCEFIFCIYPIPDCPSSRTPGAVGSFAAPGDHVKRLSRPGTDRSVLFFLHVFLLGFLVEETPCEHRENLQTPHRKAREIA